MGRSTAIIAIVSLSILACGGTSAENPDITGTWEGELVIEDMELRLVASFSVEGELVTGTLDIPQQQARDLELTDIAQSGDSVFFSLPSNLGQADFLGTVAGDTMGGDYLQGGFRGTFLLIRTEAVPELPLMPGEEVTISGEDCTLAGTLTIPESTAPHPCIVLLSGSGLQDRDEYVMGFPVFAELTSIFDPLGFAVLRCDDRGVGGSSGGLDSFSDSTLLYDAGLMLDHVLADPRIDPDRIGLLGHSEGSNTAFMLAAGRPDDVAFVISMAGPAVPGYDLIPGQLEVILAMQGFTQEQIDSKMRAQYMIMDAVLAGDSALIDSVFREQIMEDLSGLPDDAAESLGDLDAYVDQAVASAVSSTVTPWFRNFLVRDPSEYAGQVDAPVLCLFGGLDIQVIAEQNMGPMLEALADNPDHSVILFENANHLFQEAVTGGVEEYAELEPRFVEGFADTLSAWLNRR